MDLNNFFDFPDDASLWIYGFRQALTTGERHAVKGELEAFLGEWVSHGAPVRGSYKIVEDRFVLLTGHTPGGISGCSMDSSVRVFKTLKDRHGLDGLDRSLVYYRDAQGEIQGVHFSEFQKLVEKGQIDAETKVFDTTLTSLDDLRLGAFEKPFANSWHARSFPLPAS